MTRVGFEELLGFHCAPVLMGEKPANLVSVSKTRGNEDAASCSCLSDASPTEHVPALIKEYTSAFAGEGIRVEILCNCARHYMVLVYRPDRLTEYLKSPRVAELLWKDGYPKGGDLSCMLELLKMRFAAKRDFPHEIGLFLGYPVEDVVGFRKHKGSNYKMCGYWKVYGDVAYARETFARFDQCRSYLLGQLKAGCGLAQAIGMRPIPGSPA